MIGGILFFVLSVCLIRYNFWTVRDREFKHGMHTEYSTNDVLSNDSKVNDNVTLTGTFSLKWVFLDFVSARDLVFH